MYRLLDKEQNLIAFIEKPFFIRFQQNGSYGPSSKKDACGVCYNGTVYHIAGKPYMVGDEPDVILDEKDDGEIIRGLISDISDFIVDQKYRIITLEIMANAYIETSTKKEEES